MSNLEEYLFKSHNAIVADKNYIACGTFVVSKDSIKNRILKQFKTVNNVFAMATDIPFDKGEDFDCTSIGTECILAPNNNIIIKYNERWGVEYSLIKMVLEHFSWDFPYFTVVFNKHDNLILKIWGQDDKFLGCLCGYILKQD